MKSGDFYNSEYSDYCLILTTFRPICPSAFFRSFMSNSGAYTELRTEPFIYSTGVDCSNSVNHDRAQVLSYTKYSLLSYLWVGLNLQPLDDFTQKHFPTKSLIHSAICTLKNECVRWVLCGESRDNPKTHSRNSFASDPACER